MNILTRQRQAYTDRYTLESVMENTTSDRIISAVSKLLYGEGIRSAEPAST